MGFDTYLPSYPLSGSVGSHPRAFPPKPRGKLPNSTTAVPSPSLTKRKGLTCIYTGFLARYCVQCPLLPMPDVYRGADPGSPAVLGDDAVGHVYRTPFPPSPETWHDSLFPGIRNPPVLAPIACPGMTSRSRLHPSLAGWQWFAMSSSGSYMRPLLGGGEAGPFCWLYAIRVVTGSKAAERCSGEPRHGSFPLW